MIYQKLIIEYSDDLIKGCVDDNLLGNNNFAYVNNNINMDNKAKSNFHEEITGNNSYMKNFKINIEDLF